MNVRRAALLWLAAGAWLVTPPVTASLSCTLKSWFSSHYATDYQATEPDAALIRKAKPLSERVYARVILYKMTTPQAETRPCQTITLNTTLYLQRQDSPDFAFDEIHEYYAADNTLITEYRQDITTQLTNSGFYAATGELPIPDGAPAGRYRILSKLLLTHKPTNRKFLLATAKASFHIVDQ